MNETHTIAHAQRIADDFPEEIKYMENPAPKYSVIDTETSGLFDFAKPADADGQPRMASIAIININENLDVESVFHHLIKPEGWTLDENGGAAKVNGLTNAVLNEKGIPVRQALDFYSKMVGEGRIVVAFNAQYDLKILRGELRRAGMPDMFDDTKNICVMRGLTDIVKMPKASGKGYKFPKLAEAMAHFGIVKGGAAHDAYFDADACLDLFREMVKLGLVPEAKVHYAKVAPGKNTREEIGANNPPEPIEAAAAPSLLSPFEAAKKRIEDLYGEAQLWLDGAPVDNADLAAGLNNLRNMIKDAGKKAEEARVIEKEPHLVAGREVDGRYKPLSEMVAKADTACKNALAPWLKKVADDLAAEQAEKRRIADEAIAAAQAALRAADHANLAEVEAANDAVKEAQIADRVATKSEKSVAAVQGGVGRRALLETVYTPVLVDAVAALSHYWRRYPDEFHAFVLSLAERDVKAKVMDIPGFRIDQSERVK